MIAGRYTLEQEIGRGGAGVVHLAHDKVLGRSVAIKRLGLLPGTTTDDVVRAEREARLAAGINHPHVVSILDLVRDEDCYWLVMELVDGRTLAELVRAEGPLPTARAAGILAQAADALVQAHKSGIVHRDVKPSNIMVNDVNHAKLGDFGIARAASDAALTQTGFVTGSPAYLAPDVATGAPATTASDVWSLGGTLYFAIVGRPPYDVGENVLGGLYKIVHDEPPRLPEDHPVAGLLTMMMVKDPDERWTALQVRDDLRRIARGERSSAVQAQPSEDQPDEDDATAVLGTGLASSAAEPNGAQTLTTPTAAPRPEPTPVAVGAAPVAAAPATSTASGSERRPLGWIVAVLALVLLAGLGAWLLWPGDGERPGPTAGAEQTEDPTPSEEPSEEPAEEPSASEEPSAEPTEEPTTEPSPEPTSAAPTRASMQAFIQDYFATATSDSETSFGMLTPQFQAATGGYGRYAGFWSTIESATPSGIQADPTSLTASYTVVYNTTSGRTSTEQKRLQLARDGDRYLIASEG